ncbi:MAG: Cobalt-precorrin 6A reductase [Desulfonauticus sp. 38_4375]|nr:MAG: Cobalt-precorrin 6A reductase [Desulfonauticus sp. 38_4375]
MSKILILGGTEESREAVFWADKLGLEPILSTLTSWELKLPFPVERITGPLTKDSFLAFLRQEGILAVVDATHPFACEISQLAWEVCTLCSLPLFSYLRPQADFSGLEVMRVDSHLEAREKLWQLKKSFLLTVGIKNLAQYLPLLQKEEVDFYLKVLPQSFAQAKALGIPEKRILALPPFLKARSWQELLDQLGVEVVVSKDVGHSISFQEKLFGCRLSEVKLLLINRPQKTTGRVFYSLPELMQAVKRKVSSLCCAL